MKALQQLRALRRGNVHAGYRWAMIAGDCELICENCVEENYEQIYRATLNPAHGRDWQCVGVTYSGESETTERCAHCSKTIWELED